MGEAQIRILLDALAKYTHKIYLYYDSKEDSRRDFLKPSWQALHGNHGITLTALRATKENTYIHFMKDYDT